MSEETKRRLQEATAAAAQVRAVAGQKKIECLSQIAVGLAGRLDMIAKQVAQAEPEVTKTLGKDGIQQLRAELANEAQLLAADIQSAADRIKWPVHSGYGKIEARKIHSSLFDYLYGTRVNKIAAVFKRHGYSVRDDNRERTQGLVLPQQLYEEDQFRELAQALSALGEAEDAVKAAQATDDRSTVDDIWGE